jgi:hypothetical protein
MNTTFLVRAAAVVGVAAVSFVAGDMFGVQSVPKTEKHWQLVIDDCHRFLEAGLPADFGNCVAGGRYQSSR